MYADGTEADEPPPPAAVDRDIVGEAERTGDDGMKPEPSPAEGPAAAEADEDESKEGAS